MGDSILTLKLDYSVLRKQVAALILSSSRSIPDIVNQTALNVIGRAFNLTPRAEQSAIIRSLGGTVKVNRLNKKNKIVKTTILAGVRKVRTDRGDLVPLAALMINKRRGQRGLPGLYGQKMTQMIIRLLKFKQRSIGFEASGWIPGMKEIIPRLKRPFIIAKLKGVVVYKQPKGSARPATAGFRSVATVINNVRNIDRIGSRALQQGIDQEARDIGAHLEEKMKTAKELFNAASRK